MSAVSLVPGAGPVMIRVRVSRYIAGEASGSTISDPGSGSGYSELLERALARVVPGGGTIILDREAADDFAEWCGDLAGAVVQGGNPAGGRALAKLATELRATRPIHFQTGSSRVRCGATGWDLGEVTTTPPEVTCEACKPRVPSAGALESSANTTAPQGQKESSTMAAGTKGTGRRVVARKGGAAAKKGSGAKPAAAAKKGGGSTGRTGAVAKINTNVTKIAKALRDGATMKSQKAEYGVSDDGPIRAALYRAGFDSKGAKHGEEKGSINAGNAAGKKQLVKLRKDGAAWFRLAFLADITEGEVKKVVAEAGGPTGRVYSKTAKEAATSGR